MARFLHIADVHLGIKRYNLPDRTLDFFRAWNEVIERYAIGRQVDFVLVAGDLFDQRKVDPQAANHAMLVLRRLEKHNIPVVVIEGNHDQSEGVSRYSWLRSFSQWRHLKLLEPAWDEGGKLRLEPWDESRATGSYVDIGDARIFGSTWYGTTVGQTLPLLAAAVREKRRSGATNIMMLHSDIEGQLNRPVQYALSISKLKELREAVDYLALGHTHKRFDIEGWAFNPGSLEACNVEEAGTERGAYLVETSGPQIKPEFLKAGSDYFQRPFRRLELQVDGKDEPESIQADILELIRKECAAFAEVADEEKPIIEVTLRGQLGFKNSLLRLDKLKERAIDQFQPLGLMINNKTVPRQLAVATGLDQDASPTAREVRIIEDLIKPDSRFGRRAADLAAVVIEVKRLTLEGEAPEKLYKLIEERLFHPSSVRVDQAVPDPVPTPVQQWPGEGPGLQSELLPFAELFPPEAAEAATADRRD
ncbi:MAG TPA: exonuclease SbcCD subunit D [Blastocatellia bacterium]|nr:exonuclease SbcCD subunit D [Blastocatellia bacterium]